MPYPSKKRKAGYENYLKRSDLNGTDQNNNNSYHDYVDNNAFDMADMHNSLEESFNDDLNSKMCQTNFIESKDVGCQTDDIVYSGFYFFFIF